MPDSCLIKCLSGKKKKFEAQDDKESAKRIPYEAEKQYVVYWIALVTGYMEEGLTSVVESLFWKMPEENVHAICPPINCIAMCFA